MLKPCKRFGEFLCLIILLSYIISAAAGEDDEDQTRLVWTKSMGVSYPLVASVSGGLNISRYAQKSEAPFNKLSLQASVDLGIGGGMVSGGFVVPLATDMRHEVRCLVIKVAALRTWLIDIGAERNRTYTGPVVEYFGAAAGMGAKIGIGYFQSKGSAQSRDDRTVYLYAGLGL